MECGVIRCTPWGGSTLVQLEPPPVGQTLVFIVSLVSSILENPLGMLRYLICLKGGPLFLTITESGRFEGDLEASLLLLLLDVYPARLQHLTVLCKNWVVQCLQLRQSLPCLLHDYIYHPDKINFMTYSRRNQRQNKS